MRAGWTWPRWTSLCAAAIVHLAAAPHGVCWEHGVVVDLDTSSPTHQAPVPATVPGLDRAPDSAVRSDAHPHCPALWVLRASRTAAMVSVGPVAPPEAPEPGLPPRPQEASR